MARFFVNAAAIFLAASVKFAATATFVCAALAVGIASKVVIYAAAPSAVTIAQSERKLFIKRLSLSPRRNDQCALGAGAAVLRPHLRLSLLSFCGRAGKHRRYTFWVDIEGYEGQGLASEIAPLVHEIKRFVDEGTRCPRDDLAIDCVGPRAGQDIVQRRARSMVWSVGWHSRRKCHAREVEII